MLPHSKYCNFTGIFYAFSFNILSPRISNETHQWNSALEPSGATSKLESLQIQDLMESLTQKYITWIQIPSFHTSAQAKSETYGL